MGSGLSVLGRKQLNALMGIVEFRTPLAESAEPHKPQRSAKQSTTVLADSTDLIKLKVRTALILPAC